MIVYEILAVMGALALVVSGFIVYNRVIEPAQTQREKNRLQRNIDGLLQATTDLATLKTDLDSLKSTEKHHAETSVNDATSQLERARAALLQGNIDQTESSLGYCVQYMDIGRQRVEILRQLEKATIAAKPLPVIPPPVETLPLPPGATSGT